MMKARIERQALLNPFGTNLKCASIFDMGNYSNIFLSTEIIYFAFKSFFIKQNKKLRYFFREFFSYHTNPSNEPTNVT